MKRAAFLDTNILIYAAIQPDPRSVAARALLGQRCLISVQVLNEFANVAHRRLHRSWAEIDAALRHILILCPSPVPIDLETHELGRAVADRTGYGFYDSLIVAAALKAGCETLWSEDLHHGQVIDRRLTIRNPFAA